MVLIQDWPSGDPQEMKELLDKLTQENQHIALLEAQLKVRIHSYFMQIISICSFIFFRRCFQTLV